MNRVILLFSFGFVFFLFSSAFASTAEGDFLYSYMDELMLEEVDSMAHCPGDDIRLAAIPDAQNFPFNTPSFRYEISRDGGQTWSAWIAQTQLLNIAVNDLPSRASFRVIAAEDPSELTDPNRFIVSNTINITYNDIADCYTVPVTVDGGLCNQNLGDNVVPLGNFGRGNQPFRPALPTTNSAYPYRDTLQIGDWENGSFYSILNNWEEDICNPFQSFQCWDIPLSDNSPELEGYAMLVNTDEGDTSIFLRNNIPDLCELTTYQFSIDIRNIDHPDLAPNNPMSAESVILPEIEVIIGEGNVPIALLDVAPATENLGQIPNDSTWQTYGFTFTTNAGISEITFALRNVAPAGQGNDFMIDNVSIRRCDEANIAFPVNICADDPSVVTFEAQPGPAFTGGVIQWQITTDYGVTWNNLPGETNPTLVRGINDTINYRYIVAEDIPRLNMPGCRVYSDSTSINFIQNIITLLNDTICNGDTFTFFGQTFDTTGVYPFSLTAATGCDSIVQLNLTVLDPIQERFQLSVCEGEMIENVPIMNDTTLILNLLSERGCDSTVTLNITAIEPIETVNMVELCPGSQFEGIPYFRDTILIDSLFSAAGCDSIVKTQVDIFPVDELVENIAFCLGGIFEGNLINRDTSLVFEQFDQNGCLQIRTVNITAVEPEEFVLQGDPTLCRGESTFLEVVGDYPSIQWSTGAEDVKQILVDQSGLYGVTVTTEENCVQSNEVTVLTTDLTPRLSFVPPLCAGVDDGIISVDTVVGGITPYIFSLNGGTFSEDPTFIDLQPGNYSIEIIDAQGCSITEAVTLSEPDTFKIAPSYDVELDLGNSIVLSASPDSITMNDYRWEPSIGLDCDTCRTPLASPIINTNYNVTAIDSNGCVATTLIRVFLNNTSIVFVPNAFSPNSDGLNDFLMPNVSTSVASINTFIIYDRWGNILYEAYNFAPGEETIKWNGTLNDQFLKSAVYVWYVEVELVTGGTYRDSGDVLLIR